MAGLPLKSGADFYNLEAARLRLQNLGADPTEVGAGLIYFNTSTGLNTSQKARLYTGSAWKTIAFAEDLDVASNADFLALKDKVDLLSGDVDTDAIISNMKEVSAFLEGFAEDASLMDLLKGKLNTSGGTIRGAGAELLRIIRTDGNPYISFLTDGNLLGRLGFSTNGVPIAIVNSQLTTLLHSGNVGDYAVEQVPSSYYLDLSQNYTGQTAKVFSYFQRIGTETDMSGNIGSARKGVIRMSGGGSESQLLFDHYNGELYYRNYKTAWSAWKTIAFTDSDITGNAETATKLATARTIWGQSFDGTGNVSGMPRFSPNTYSSSITTSSSSIVLSSKAVSMNGYNTGIAWAAIAGLDTNYRDHIHAWIGLGERTSTSGAELYPLVFATNNSTTANTAPTERMRIMPNGNVLIGTTTDTGERLQVKGDIGGVEHLSFVGGWISMGVVRNSSNVVQDLIIQANGSKPLSINPSDNNNVLIGTNTDNGSGARLQVNGGISIAGYESITYDTAGYLSIREGGANKRFLICNPTGVLLGYETTDRPAKIYGTQIELKSNTTIEGNLHVTGNIIADGEVSAGGAGEEGGGSSSGGGGAFHSEGIAVGATQTTIAHGLGTDDIVVSIYEKDGVSGRWSIILTDVEIVDANNIIVSFGSATTVEHKVVIMGAVA